MPHASMEHSKLLIRMTADDRQAINRMLQHKREEFESVIKKGVVAMLNTIEENNHLAEQRSEYLNFLTQKNRHRKQQLANITQAAKDATQTAPFAAGTAAHLALNLANGAATRVLDGIEEKRQEAEVETRYFAAQMLYYIPPQDYESIAESVAKILSYRYQFLLFRLAVGENGYIKLANFFIKSMKNYAIARLREGKSNPVKALINAAIPPSSDALSYRDWPGIDFANFRSHLSHIGQRKTLELDEDANAILRRCGPAVRALLGGLNHYVDDKRAKSSVYHAYTILGALNHAPILSADTRVISGLQDNHPRINNLDGYSKYPFILLKDGENSADLGVNFATKSTNESLDALQLKALQRILPEFIPDKLRNDAPAWDLRYPEEKSECPWTKSREQEWEIRLHQLYSEKKSTPIIDAFESDERVLKNQLLLNKSLDLNMEACRVDAEKTYNELLKSFQNIYEVDVLSEERRARQHHVINQAKYASLAAKNLLASFIRADAFPEEHMLFTKKIISTTQLLLSISRYLPVRECLNYQKAYQLHAKIQNELDELQNFKLQFISAYLQWIEYLEHKDIPKGHKELLEQETNLRIVQSKKYKYQINECLEELNKLEKFGLMLSRFDHNIPDTEAQANQNYQDLVQELHQGTYQSLDEYLRYMLEETLFICKLIENASIYQEAKIIHITTSQEDLADLLKTIQNSCQDAKTKIERMSSQSRGMWSKSRDLQQSLLLMKDEIHRQFELALNLFHQLEYTAHTDIPQTQNLFARHKKLRELSWLIAYYLKHDKPEMANLFIQHAQNLQFSIKKEQNQVLIQARDKMHINLNKEDTFIKLHELYQQTEFDKNQLELACRDDIELQNILFNHAQKKLTQAYHSEQLMRDILNKIQYISDQFEKINMQAEGEQSLYVVDMPEKLSKLIHCFPQLDFSDLQAKLQLNSSQDNELKSFVQAGKIILETAVKKANPAQHTQSIRLKVTEMTMNMDDEPFEHQITRKSAIKILKQALEELNLCYQKKEEKEVFEFQVQENKKSFVHQTLIWAGTLKVAEQKWLDQKISTKSKRLQIQSVKHKSAIRMFYSLMLALSSEQIIHKKMDLSKLRQLEQILTKTKVNAHLFFMPSQEELEPLQQQRTHLQKIISQKIERYKSELKDVEELKKNMLDKSLRLFFNDWKLKTAEANNVSIQAKPIVPIISQEDEKPIKSEAQEEEKQYSIEELEESIMQLSHIKYASSMAYTDTKSSFSFLSPS